VLHRLVSGERIERRHRQDRRDRVDGLVLVDHTTAGAGEAIFDTLPRARRRRHDDRNLAGGPVLEQPVEILVDLRGFGRRLARGREAAVAEKHDGAQNRDSDTEGWAKSHMDHRGPLNKSRAVWAARGNLQERHTLAHSGVSR